jgi:hypothetical protein
VNEIPRGCGVEPAYYVAIISGSLSYGVSCERLAQIDLHHDK